MIDREATGVAAALDEVRSRIRAAAERAGRPEADVALLAVTKTVPPERVREALDAGQRLFGENRVQEARDKIRALGEGGRWHMIGHLQKNKAKAAVELFDVIESVDSPALAAEIDRRAEAAGKKMRVFVQVKVAEEASKSGVDEKELPSMLERVQSLPNLVLEGLMAIPPFPRTAEDSRPYFARLRKLREGSEGACCPAGTLRHLSMGMTADFEVAVEEGATIVRVGSALFGVRPPVRR